MENREPQFLPIITTDGMVNIHIQNRYGEYDCFLSVLELRKILEDSLKSYPPENCVRLR